MKLKSISVAALLAVIGFSSQAQADLLSYRIPKTLNPIMDGEVSKGEWNIAGNESDGNGLAGTTYAMWKEGLDYGSGKTYDGRFSFLLHNIEQNTTEWNGAGGTDPAFNVFDIYKPDDKINKYLEINVTYNGFSVNKYNSSGDVIDTVEFIYTGNNAPNQIDNYDWDKYFGVYAKGGYGNSAYTSGLVGSINNDNQLFEVAYRTPLISRNPPVRRSVKDPDQLQNWQVVTYIDTTVKPVPEPATMILFGTGLAGLAGRMRKKKQPIS